MQRLGAAFACLALDGKFTAEKSFSTELLGSTLEKCKVSAVEAAQIPYCPQDGLYVGDRIKEKIGFPQLTACCKPLRYKEFIISYDTKNRIPNWVYEHLCAGNFETNDPCDRRVNICPYNEDAAALGLDKPKFHPDCRVHGYHRADVRDYCDTDYELGLMADPANYPFDKEACCETQVMTNVVPIAPGFSCGPWFDLQCYIRDKLVKENRSVYVCSGPMFRVCDEGNKDKNEAAQMKFDVLGEGEVSVPTDFFKVIIIESHDGNLELESYVVENVTPDDKDADKPLDAYLTPLNKIEHATGLIFFPDKKMCYTSNNKRRGHNLHAL